MYSDAAVLALMLIAAVVVTALTLLVLRRPTR